MISIVICSINKDYLKNVSENISKTIGTPYELLVWDNFQEQRGLCEIYNLMAAKAGYPFICFLHEDIFFETVGWGLILAGLFRDHPETGVIGIAGAAYKSAMCSGWHMGNDQYDRFNYTHRINGVDHKERQPADGGDLLFPVVCIDGVLMACRRETWEDIRFDDDNLKGFHFYDIDFSLRASMKYGVGVSMEIDLVHITQGGDYGDRWVQAAIKYHDRQKRRLPYWLDTVVREPAVRRTELAVAGMWLDRLKNEKISFRHRWQWISRQHLLPHPMLWYPIARFFIFRPLRLQKLRQWMNRNLSSHPRI